MNRNVLRRGLAWCLVAVVLLPVALAVDLGLAALLAALGDTAAAAACGRVALGLGVMFVVAIVATTVMNAMHGLVRPPRRRARRRRRGRQDAAATDRGLGTP